METSELKGLVRDFLNAHRKAVFATMGDGNQPATSLMLYVIDDELNVYFGTRKAFRKYGQLKAHPKIGLSVIEEALDPLKVVDMQGTAVELSGEDQDRAFEFFKSKNPSKYYVENAEDYVMFKIHPNFIRWLDATTGELTITEL